MIHMLKSKIHSVVASGADLHYEGSIAIDQSLMEMANIHENEKVHVWNKTNGSRHETYAIKAPPGSGEITVNGAAAHLVSKGDELIIATFTMIEESKVASHKPIVVLIKDKSKNVGYLKP
ncbi:MAG: aspartate 1-decarboxylase [Proteobacteria bacterium]|jgi:aspartate 1-decarboxylase|nr:aspartate 1-decarboxylase [Pseudomonadota bacterium]